MGRTAGTAPTAGSGSNSAGGNTDPPTRPVRRPRPTSTRAMSRAASPRRPATTPRRPGSTTTRPWTSSSTDSPFPSSRRQPCRVGGGVTRWHGECHRRDQLVGDHRRARPTPGPTVTIQVGAMYQVSAPGVFIGTSRATLFPSSQFDRDDQRQLVRLYRCREHHRRPEPVHHDRGAADGHLPGTGRTWRRARTTSTSTSPTPPRCPATDPTTPIRRHWAPILGTAESVTPIAIGAPVFTSAASTTFAEGVAGTFAVTATGDTPITFTETGGCRPASPWQQRHPGGHAGCGHGGGLPDHHHGDRRQLEHVDAELHPDGDGVAAGVHLGGVDDLRREHGRHLRGHGHR